MKEQGIPAGLSRCMEFHGHLCAGLVIGYKAAVYGISLMGITPPHENLYAIVANDSCAFDAVQVMTGCTFGKGNITFWDHGKHVYIFGLRDHPQAVRLYAKGIGESRRHYPDHLALAQKVLSGDADEEERQRYEQNNRRLALSLLEVPDSDFFDVQEVEMQPPPKARIFRNLRCELCEEECMETRVRICEGKTLCLPCLARYCPGG